MSQNTARQNADDQHTLRQTLNDTWLLQQLNDARKTIKHNGHWAELSFLASLFIGFISICIREGYMVNSHLSSAAAALCLKQLGQNYYNCFKADTEINEIHNKLKTKNDDELIASIIKKSKKELDEYMTNFLRVVHLGTTIWLSLCGANRFPEKKIIPYAIMFLGFVTYRIAERLSNSPKKIATKNIPHSVKDMPHTI